MASQTAVKPLVLKNVATGEERHDRLYQRAQQSMPCSSKACTGSRMLPSEIGRTYVHSREVVLSEARKFLEQFYEDPERLQTRWASVQQEIESRGTYELKEEELVFGARTAWRNAPRCIGRIQWNNLKLFDARRVRNTDEMFLFLVEHVKFSTNGGNLRSSITIFPPRTDGQHDYRIWNPQLISYAGYRNQDGSVTGDPISIEFTEICEKLGWKSKRTHFDVLPWILQANGGAPKLYEIPEEIVMQVEISHPQYDWLTELGLRWYALPAVSGMLFDCGGVLFPCAPFNGWYMGTEIACRDFCDPQRYNLTEKIAKRMGLSTDRSSTLWKDTVVLELNKAVLYSYQKQGVTLWDHHTASESFMTHYKNEMRVRGGCPADWVWLVPPMSSSLCPVFHQEMSFYQLKPSYEYQSPAWKGYKWNDDSSSELDKTSRNRNLRIAAGAVFFSSSLFRRCLGKRPSMTILFASESGKAEKFAHSLASLVDSMFRMNVLCMDKFEAAKLEHETLIAVVASTFGNGDPPTNGIAFHHDLMKLKRENKLLPDLTYTVFALGSTAYPNFCAFGKCVDKTLSEMGAERFMDLHCGDEMNGQEKSFQHWAAELCRRFSCTFAGYKGSLVLTPTVKEDIPYRTAEFEVSQSPEDLIDGLRRMHKKNVLGCCLHRKSVVGNADEYGVLLVSLDIAGIPELCYQPGDHIAVIPRNDGSLVRRLIARLDDVPDETAVVKLKLTDGGDDPSESIAPATLSTVLSCYVDLNTPPTQDVLKLFARNAADDQDKKKLLNLAEDADMYRQWREQRVPSILEVLQQFPSVRVKAADLVANLPVLQPRFYSVSSSMDTTPDEVHLTVGILNYETPAGQVHRGVCSSYLADRHEGEEILCYLRPSPSFRVPKSYPRPIILVGPGTGIAPFRGIWLQRYAELRKAGMVKDASDPQHQEIRQFEDIVRRKNSLNRFIDLRQLGPIYLYTGFRSKSVQLYAKEMQLMLQAGALNKAYTCYSRQPKQPKMYVQDLLRSNGQAVAKQILEEKALMFICGDAQMADQVEATVVDIVRVYGGVQVETAQIILANMKDENRYRVEVFGSKAKSTVTNGNEE